MKLTGLAIAYNADSLDLGGFTEVIRPGAAAEAVRNADVLALWNHQSGEVLGRTSAGTLRLNETAEGVTFALDLPDTGRGRDAADLVRRKDVRGCSFGFMVPRARDERWTRRQDGTLLREIFALRLIEITLTALPAYPATRVALDRAAGRSAPAATDTARSARIERKRKALDAAEARRPMTPGQAARIRIKQNRPRLVM